MPSAYSSRVHATPSTCALRTRSRMAPRSTMVRAVKRSRERVEELLELGRRQMGQQHQPRRDRVHRDARSGPVAHADRMGAVDLVDVMHERPLGHRQPCHFAGRRRQFDQGGAGAADQAPGRPDAVRERRRSAARADSASRRGPVQRRPRAASEPSRRAAVLLGSAARVGHVGDTDRSVGERRQDRERPLDRLNPRHPPPPSCTLCRVRATIRHRSAMWNYDVVNQRRGPGDGRQPGDRPRVIVG